MKREGIYEVLNQALESRRSTHGDHQWGRHEMYGILLEEVDEIWDAIKRNAPIEELRAEMYDAMVVLVHYLETGDKYWGSRHYNEGR